jgi:hypothetical protein
VQMIALKSELHIIVNDRVATFETEARKKAADTDKALQTMKTDMLNASQEQFNPVISQLERRVQENRTMLGALKSELLIELHERISQ